MLPLMNKLSASHSDAAVKQHPAAGGAQRGIQHRILIGRRTAEPAPGGAQAHRARRYSVARSASLRNCVLSVTDPVDRPAAHRFLQALGRFAGPIGRGCWRSIP